MLAKRERFLNDRRNNMSKSAIASGVSAVATGVSAVLCWLSVEHCKAIFPAKRPEEFPLELYLTMIAIPLSGVVALFAFLGVVFFLHMAVKDYYKYKDAIEDAELDPLLISSI